MDNSRRIVTRKYLLARALLCSSSVMCVACGRPYPAAFPVGSVVAFTGDQVPDGWLLCDGRALRRRDWPALYVVLGTSHGAGVSEVGVREGDFNLPDYRGRFLRGVDSSTDGRSLGADPDAMTRSPARAGTGNAGNHVGSYQSDATALPRDPTRAFQVRMARLETMDRAQAARVDTVVIAATWPTRLDSVRPPTVAFVIGGDAETRPKNVAVRWIVRARP